MHILRQLVGSNMENKIWDVRKMDFGFRFDKSKHFDPLSVLLSYEESDVCWTDGTVGESETFFYVYLGRKLRKPT